MTELGGRRYTIAILALGGQGGGVLADWIIEAASHAGLVAQGTSVPGVAQRTGSTIYYIELFRPSSSSSGAEPVLALSPVPGDVDVVLASELMEAGRAIVRGFVSGETVLIGSTHRVYAISEKSALADGRFDGGRVLEAAKRRAKRFIGFDMDQGASASGSVISSVMLGALAGADVLPITPDQFRNAIEAGGKAVAANLRGFDHGFKAAAAPSAEEASPLVQSAPALPADLADDVAQKLPRAARDFARHGVARLIDYQDRAYAELYISRLNAVSGVASRNHPELVTELARHLALWMSYEDTIRVADLKTRSARIARVRDEVRAASDQPVHIVEYMHPRFQEVCETLPAPLGSRMLASHRIKRLLAPLFKHGRHVRTTSLTGFLLLYFLAGLRRWRRRTLRFVEENRRIERWLDDIKQAIAVDPAASLELVRCQDLIKGYGETFERGLRSFEAVMAAWGKIRADANASRRLAEFRLAALADEEGKTLAEAVEKLAA